jgi:hypothetical protein
MSAISHWMFGCGDLFYPLNRALVVRMELARRPVLHGNEGMDFVWRAQTFRPDCMIPAFRLLPSDPTTAVADAARVSRGPGNRLARHIGCSFVSRQIAATIR